MGTVPLSQNRLIINLSSEEVELPDFQEMLCCPQTKNPVAKANHQTLLIPGGQATWWYCRECRGWHVITET